MEVISAQQFRELYVKQQNKAKKRSRAPRGVAQSVKKLDTDLFQKLAHEDLGILFEKEYRFHPSRQWRFDYACPELKIAVEVEGGVWTQGRHTRGAGFMGDIEKYNAASSMGWVLIRTTPEKLCKAFTFDTIRQTLKTLKP